MNTQVSQKEKTLHIAIFLTFALWALVTTWSVAPLYSPEWASGILYILWLGMVFWALSIVSMTPTGLVMFLGFKFFKVPGMVFFSFVFIYLIDAYLNRYYPALPLTPGFGLGAVYACVFLKERGFIKM